MSILSSIVDRGSIPLVEKMAAFTEARHQMITENIANIDTPGYRMRQLDPKAFQAELRRAAQARTPESAELRLKSTRQVESGCDGHMELHPELEPTENLMFQDGTNARIERQMSDLADNAMAHQLSIELLKTQYG